MNFSEITIALKELSQISSGNEKIEWLKNHDDKDLKNILSWYFDTSKVTGIAEKKFNSTKISLTGTVPISKYATFDDVISYLELLHTGRDQDIVNVRDYMDIICKTDLERETFKNLVCKNYPMGINYTTINKVYPGLVPCYEVMLADKYLDLDDEHRNKLFAGREFVIQEKLDGFRCTAWKKNGKVSLVSRQGKPIEGLIDVETALKEFFVDDFVMDGELIITDRENIPSKMQYKATSKIVSTKHYGKYGITFNVFDWVSVNEWNSKTSTQTYDERYDELKTMIEANDVEPFIRLVPCLYKGSDISKIDEYLAYAKSKDWEGVMVRFSDSFYEWKRSKNLLKVKPFLEMDMNIVGYEEGTNSNKNKLGAFLCEVNHPKYGNIKCKVGGGYSDDERTDFWKVRDSLIGYVMSVQYFEVTQNTTTNEYSLRFPEFLELKPFGQKINN